MKFPVPKTGEQIPEGWHAELVKFVNSLVPCGDGGNVLVSHTPTGVTISAMQKKAGGSGSGRGDFSHPFKVTVSGDTCTVAGGYVIGYNEAVYLQDKKISNSSGASFIYIAVRPEVNNHVIRAEIELTGKKEYREDGVYYYPVAEWKEAEDGTRTLVQHQFGNLVTPFRRKYIPVIEASLQCLLQVKEGEGDEIKIMLQDDIAKGGPLGNHHLCTKSNRELYWHRCDDDDESDSSSPDNDDSSSSLPSDSGGTVDDLIPGKWYVFVRYYSTTRPLTPLFDDYAFSTPEEFHELHWGREINQWVEDLMDDGNGGGFVVGYYYNNVASGPLESIDECAAWWQQNGHMYDPDMEPPETM